MTPNSYYRYWIDEDNTVWRDDAQHNVVDVTNTSEGRQARIQLDNENCLVRFPDVEERVGKPTTFEQALDVVLGELRELMISKQQDYGPGNITAFGEYGVLVRASDKFERLKNLLAPGSTTEPQHESIDDSWKDWANYGIIALLLRRNLWGLPLENDNA